MIMIKVLFGLMTNIVVFWGKDMKYCPYCGAGLKDNMVYCPKCGNEFEDAINNNDIVETDKDRLESGAKERDHYADAALRTANMKTIEHGANNKEKIQRKKKRALAGLGVLFALCMILGGFLVWHKRNEQDSADKGHTGGSSTSDVEDENVDVDIDIAGGAVSPLVKEAVKSVLFLEMFDDKDELVGTASGFIIEDGNTMVTNYHVIENACSIVAWTADYKESYAVETLLAYSVSKDLAVLKCDTGGSVQPLKMGDSDNVSQGDRVYAVGYPLGVANTLSEGIVSSRYVEDDVDYLQITAAISQGSSGGAILNENAEVVGVASAYYVNGQNLNLAISSADLVNLIASGYAEQSLAEYYLILNSKGNTPVNLLGGGIVAENETYTFIVDDAGKIHRLGGEEHYLESNIYGRDLNVYRDSLYYYDFNKNEIMKCDLNFEHRIAVGVLSKQMIYSEYYTKGYSYEEIPSQVLIAKDRIFMNLSFYNEKNQIHGKGHLVVVNLEDASEVIYCSAELDGYFSYSDNCVYAGLEGGGILKLDMRTLEETVIQENRTINLAAIKDDGVMLFTDIRNNAILLLDAKNDSIYEEDLSKENFAVDYYGNRPFVNSVFAYDGEFYMNVYDRSAKANYLLKMDGRGKYVYVGEGLPIINYGVSPYYSKYIFLNYGEDTMEFLDGSFINRGDATGNTLLKIRLKYFRGEE